MCFNGCIRVEREPQSRSGPPSKSHPHLVPHGIPCLSWGRTHRYFLSLAFVSRARLSWESSNERPTEAIPTKETIYGCFRSAETATAGGGHEACPLADAHDRSRTHVGCPHGWLLLFFWPVQFFHAHLPILSIAEGFWKTEPSNETPRRAQPQSTR